MNESTLCRRRRAREIAAEHYEPGNQSRSLKQVWRKYAAPELGVCYRTFLRYTAAGSGDTLVAVK